MHRVVLFSNSVRSNGVFVYGRLYSGKDEQEILNAAKWDYKTLLVREKFEEEEGEAFRRSKNWVPVQYENGSGWWSYSQNRYTFDYGFAPIPDQFVQEIELPSESVALLSSWVPIRMADINLDDYIVNAVFYYSITECNPKDIDWINIEPEDDFPF